MRPPTFRIILALAGATLILWGAKGAILEMPVLGILSLFEMNRNAAIVLILASVVAVGASWLQPRFIAWLAWALAVGSVVYLLQDLSVKITTLRDAGLPPGTVDRVIDGIVIKPGAISVLCGLVIQAVGLSLTRKMEDR